MFVGERKTKESDLLTATSHSHSFHVLGYFFSLASNISMVLITHLRLYRFYWWEIWNFLTSKFAWKRVFIATKLDFCGPILPPFVKFYRVIAIVEAILAQLTIHIASKKSLVCRLHWYIVVQLIVFDAIIPWGKLHICSDTIEDNRDLSRLYSASSVS